MLKRNLQHGARSTIMNRSHRAAQGVQSDVNPHNAGKIVGGNIV